MGGNSAPITVNGIMNALGTSADPVVFTWYRDADYYDRFEVRIINFREPGLGYVIYNGADTLNDCLIREAGNTGGGGAVFVYQCNPSISDNVIEGCFCNGIYAK